MQDITLALVERLARILFDLAQSGGGVSFQGGESTELFYWELHTAFMCLIKLEKGAKGVLFCPCVSRNDKILPACPIPEGMDTGNAPDPGHLFQSFTLFIV